MERCRALLTPWGTGALQERPSGLYWEAYQQQHDLSGRQGQTAGIDPVSGRLSAAHRNCLASLARGNMLFLQVILFQNLWSYF